MDDKFSGGLYFPTSIFRLEVEDSEGLNRNLLKTIYSLKKSDEVGVKKSNFPELGGWHSDTRLQKNPQCAELVRKVVDVGDLISNQLKYDLRYKLSITSMWSIINGYGSFNRSHIHPNSHWSGVYYLQTPKNSGDISFTDPRTVNIMQRPFLSSEGKKLEENWTKVTHTPKVGTMLVFPSWLYHSVEPNLSSDEDNDRIIISFNMSQVIK